MFIANIREKIAKLEGEIIDIQNECSHPRAARKKMSEHTDDSGLNQFPETRTDYQCMLCEVKWSERS